MTPVISINNLNKRFSNGVVALKDVSLNVAAGEIIALLGPNGAGKTTLISIACGLTFPTSGQILVGGYDIRKDYRAARKLIGFVPQEVALERYESVIDTVNFSRGLFGLPQNNALVEHTLKILSLWDKRKSSLRELSGGMKRRVLIAKALVHEPQVLFLDEPSAGVDVQLRKEMWEIIKRLSETGATIVLTTHYIEEAEALANRVAIINNGEISIVEKTNELLKSMGGKKICFDLNKPCKAVPAELRKYNVRISNNNRTLVLLHDAKPCASEVACFLKDLHETNVEVRDITTVEKSLEEIFMSIVKEREK